jgi:hypothetical protein
LLMRKHVELPKLGERFRIAHGGDCSSARHSRKRKKNHYPAHIAAR